MCSLTEGLDKPSPWSKEPLRPLGGARLQRTRVLRLHCLLGLGWGWLISDYSSSVLWVIALWASTRPLEKAR